MHVFVSTLLVAQAVDLEQSALLQTMSRSSIGSAQSQQKHRGSKLGAGNTVSNDYVGKKCPWNHGDRLFKETEVADRTQCQIECHKRPDCKFFSYKSYEAEGDWKGNCMGCTTDAHLEDEDGFNVYSLDDLQSVPYDPYEDKKCPLGHDDRLFREEGLDLKECQALCQSTPNCKFFSHTDEGQYANVCMGCTKDDNLEYHAGFHVFSVTRVACENPNHATFGECTISKSGTCFGQARLGHGEKWSAWKEVSGDFQCTNDFFGGDPFVGQAKECICAPRVACENPHHATFDECTLSKSGTCFGQARLGYGNSWSEWKDVDGPFECSNAFFGGDPIVGQAKECVCSMATPTKNMAPSQFSLKSGRVACENPKHATFDECTLAKSGKCVGQVRLGYGDDWSAWKEVSGDFQCTNNFFGGDPIVGQAKECICARRAACENPHHATFDECSLSKSGTCFGQVRLGYGEMWSAWKEVSGAFQCTNDFFGGDPIVGQAKQCVCLEESDDA